MTLLTTNFQRNIKCCILLRSFSNFSCDLNTEKEMLSSAEKLIHCYKQLNPWKNGDEFSKYLVSCVEYNKDGLIVLNKPFGLQIYSHDHPAHRYKQDQNTNRIKFVKPSIPECKFTLQDFLPVLQEHLNLPNLSIVKSAEKYTSGIVLLSSSDKVSRKIIKSFNTAKFQKKPHIVHWAVTVGCPIVPYRKEKVGINLVDMGDDKPKQAVIETNISNRSIKLKKVYPVRVESRLISVNNELSTSLIQISSSSVNLHFVRAYASSRVAPILGDILYGSRMKRLFGIPVKVHLNNAIFGAEPLPSKLCEALRLPRGAHSENIIPTMLHWRSVILPNYEERDKDLIITVKLPMHFEWTVNKLNLFQECK